MAVFSVTPVLIVAGAERHGNALDPPARLTRATVQLVDGGAWDATAGTVTRWGVQSSADGGATWLWDGEGAVFQDGVPFGSRDRAGGMPALNIAKTDENGNPLPLAGPGILLRLAITVTANVTLGATITTG